MRAMRRVVVALTLLFAGCRSLTLDEKVGQLFSYPAHGVFMNEQSPAYQQLRRQVRENKVGGVIWFVSNVYETAWLTRELQRESRIPLLVSADIEAGVGMRFTDTTYWPPAMAVAATGDPSLAEREGRIAAREVRALGINHILAPVADVNVDPDNPVINTRSFGEDPAEVAKFVAAFVRGVQSEPVLATAKHFPGHGDTHVDSHRSLPVLDVDRERLDRVELVPFRAAVGAGVASVMMGHLALPKVDPTPAPVRSLVETSRDTPYTDDDAEITKEGTLPASLSTKIHDILRRDLGFQGLIISDAFDMGGLVAHFDAGEAAVRAIEAGEDMILKSANTDAAIKAVKEAVRSGRLSERRIDESVQRILAAKKRVHAGVGSTKEIFRTLDTNEHKEVAREIATKAITLLREEPGALPLAKGRRIALIVVSEFNEIGNPLAAVAGEIGRRNGMPPRTFVIDGRTRLEETDAIVKAANAADVVVLALAIRARSGAGTIGVPETARRVVERLTAKTVAVSFGSPYAIRDVPSLKTYICAYGTQPVLQGAAIRALFGDAPITGKLPVTIPRLHARGEGIVKNY
jgi:beta-N-acetylhexosaminidase